MQKINWDKFIDAQIKLDKTIFENKLLDYQSTNLKRKLALIVELNEFINETKVFKFWSSAEPDRKKLLTEYIDVLHFTLSLSIEYQIKLPQTEHISVCCCCCQSDQNKMINYFLELNSEMMKLLKKENFLNWFNKFIEIGNLFEFTASEIENAYFEKLNINHQRQQNNY